MCSYSCMYCYSLYINVLKWTFLTPVPAFPGFIASQNTYKAPSTELKQGNCLHCYTHNHEGK